MKAFVTGGAGFIGSSLVDALLARGYEVVVFDNLSTGQMRNLSEAAASQRFRFVAGDVLDRIALDSAITGDIDVVFHLSANADIRFGLEHPERDLQQNTIATFNVLEAMRRVGVKRIAFSSTGSVYGEPEVHPTPENAPFPVQTSLYAASKVAGENLIQAYAEGYGFTGYIFRFVSIMGRRYSHGHVFDFYKQLRQDPTRLTVLGNGKQRKSYLLVDDCIDAILTVIGSKSDKVNIYNLGTDDSCVLTQSIGWISDEMGLSPKIELAGGERGWVGDSPFIQLDISKVQRLGWSPRASIEQSVRLTVRWIAANPWILDARS